MKIKILLDTDIGTDVDDAVSLVYLFAQPEYDNIGRLFLDDPQILKYLLAPNNLLPACFLP